MEMTKNYRISVLLLCGIVMAMATSQFGYGQEPKAGERKVLTVKNVDYAFRYCPPGTFTMGSPLSETDRSNNETQRSITLTQGFWMLETEVTQEMWQSVMGNNPSHFKGDKKLPVEMVTWSDCQEFSKKLSELLPLTALRTFGGTVSLPSESQWEYACRAGTMGPYSGTGDLDDMGWYETNAGSKTHTVGTKKPNTWGLYDMHGNVWEWCSDTSPTTSGKEPFRMDRGGSWKYDQRRARAAYRFGIDPTRRNNDVGFRIMINE